jgi:hypothetical protein
MTIGDLVGEDVRLTQLDLPPAQARAIDGG